MDPSTRVKPSTAAITFLPSTANNQSSKHESANNGSANKGSANNGSANHGKAVKGGSNLPTDLTSESRIPFSDAASKAYLFRKLMDSQEDDGSSNSMGSCGKIITSSSSSGNIANCNNQDDSDASKDLKRAAIVNALQEKQRLLLQQHLRERDSQNPLDKESLQQKHQAMSTGGRGVGPGVVGDQKSGKIYLDDILQQFEAAENAVNLELQLIIQSHSATLDQEHFQK